MARHILFVDDNPLVEFHPCDRTNDTSVIRMNERVVAVNSALQVDLTGQVCADSIGHRIYSGIGGQLDGPSSYLMKSPKNQRPDDDARHDTDTFIAKYAGILAAADIPAFTTSTTFAILQSIRLDQGAGSQVHP